MPNPDRVTADGLEWECPPMILFIDDVSGNTSKQWNVHYSAYLSNGALPRAAVEKESNIHFVATSPHASPMEMMQGICDELRSVRCPWSMQFNLNYVLRKSGAYTAFRAWDSVHQRYIMVRPWIVFLPGDNPMQAELCSHIGMNSNHFCRCCHAGGTKAFKESDAGYASLLRVRVYKISVDTVLMLLLLQTGKARTPQETRDAVLRQLSLSTHAGASKRVQAVGTDEGVKDSLAAPVINRLLTIGKALRKRTTTHDPVAPKDVNAQLYAELLKTKETDIINPLLDMPGNTS